MTTKGIVSMPAGSGENQGAGVHVGFRYAENFRNGWRGRQRSRSVPIPNKVSGGEWDNLSTMQRSS